MLEAVAGRMSLHMPGGQGQAPFERWDAFGCETTELAVTDDLYRPTGAIAAAERLAAASAGAARTLLLPGGSTAGNHAMLLYACRRGAQVILPRNAHLSCLNLCAVAGIEPIFAEPSFTPTGRLYTAPEAYAAALDAHPRAMAALAVWPDYYGLMGDLQGVAEAVHARGRLLLCDSAHGATFNWRSELPNAGALGADLYVQSAHKTLPALNAGAWLNAAPHIDAERLHATLRMVQTSSPSFAVMRSLDDARAWMDERGAAACARLGEALTRFRASAAALGFADGQLDGAKYDRERLVLKAPMGGERLAEALAARGIDVEMCDSDCVVCILSLLDGPERLARLLSALREIADEGMARVEPIRYAPRPERWPERRVPLDDAAFAPMEGVPIGQSAGRVCARCVGLYPPGVAWLTPGDEITAETALLLARTPPGRRFGLTDDGRVPCVREP